MKGKPVEKKKTKTYVEHCSSIFSAGSRRSYRRKIAGTGFHHEWGVSNSEKERRGQDENII